LNTPHAPIATDFEGGHFATRLAGTGFPDESARRSLLI
jgi:hypothetical protein